MTATDARHPWAIARGAAVSEDFVLSLVRRLVAELTAGADESSGLAHGG